MILTKGYQPITSDLDPTNPPQGGSGLSMWGNENHIKILEKSNAFYIIDEIARIRSKNNDNWMAILRLAFKFAPDEAKQVMKDITECDAEINTLTKQLAEGVEK